MLESSTSPGTFSRPSFRRVIGIALFAARRSPYFTHKTHQQLLSESAGSRPPRSCKCILIQVPADSRQPQHDHLEDCAEQVLRGVRAQHPEEAEDHRCVLGVYRADRHHAVSVLLPGGQFSVQLVSVRFHFDRQLLHSGR